ncbi:DUF3943 domain-containing protein [Mucilaginibacter sp. UR6-11]|uniref:DUF3943 domain-containing protein n=1 Tax=Mucilaginibacter sp. UR6-11 TaxID=1435644 RepID=UPI001E47DFF0|nr:DUF3943 domain-containing protein [Mucilaginibacter sp. UR6-11]MCC8425860.1 DUF3943 domain-containing protein [Mucilaginibacter sp. UR6-11]
MLLAVFLPSAALHAQIAIGYEQKSIKDTLPKPARRGLHGGNKKFGRAAIELGAAEVLPWAFDKFLKKADYADISFKTVGHNLNPGSWTWDDDNFQTNQFGHPFHGSQFYNTFRSNGYTFWQSAPAAAIGSFIWESTAENQPPAINDFINTTFGGIVLGEMTYRLANKLINNERTGIRRQATEVLGFVINPANGINRILDGKWGKVSKNLKRDSSQITAEFDAGTRTFNRDNSNILHNRNYGWYGHIKLLYGTPYKDYETPFSNIAINVEFGKDDSSKVNMVSVYGSLAGWELKSNDKLQHLLVVSANYDFLHNSAFFYGGQSVKMNLLSEYDITRKTRINTVFGAGPVLLAAIPDAYLSLPHGRNYDYGPGFSINASGQLTLVNRFIYGINYRGGWTVTVNGHPSHYFLHAVSSEASIIIAKGFSFSIESGYFNLHGYYQKYPDVSSNYPYLRLSTRYTVNF